MSANLALLLFSTAATLLLSLPATAQDAFRGSWQVVKHEPAPWLAAQPSLKAVALPALVKARFSFSAARVSAPVWMACKKPKFEMMQLAYGGLFEGGLYNPDKGLNDAAPLARKLGYKAEPVASMITSCSEILFHLVDINTAQFALDNVIYTLRRR